MHLLLIKICDFLFRRKEIPKDLKNILIIRSGAIGDVFMSTPLVHTLKDSYQDIKLSYLVGEWSKPALDNNQHVDKIIAVDDGIIYKKKFFKTLKIIHQLRKKKFDLCFVLDKSWHWGIFAWLVGIPFRIGFDRFGEGFAHSQAVPFDGSKYELEYYLDLARRLDIPVQHTDIEFHLSEKDKQFAEDFFKQNKLKTKKVVIFAPGGANNPGHEMHVKRWPLENFILLAKNLSAQGIKIICVGGEQDRIVIEIICSSLKSPVLNLAGRTSISQSIALMSKAHCVVTHDSAPLHMAAAAKTKIIALFGPTSPVRFAPRESKVFFKTRGCHGCYSVFTYGTLKSCPVPHECMENIKVKEVLRAVQECLR